MAHYVFLDNQNKVVQAISGKDEEDLSVGISSWEEHYQEFIGMKCLRTSYNTYGGVHYTTDNRGNRIPSNDQTKALRKNYAGIGYTYDEERDAFIPPQPYESWILDEETCLWKSPVPYPSDSEGIYQWDESSINWILVQS